MLPLHIREGETESPRHTLCVYQDGEMRQHELCRVQHLQEGGLVPCTGVRAFDPSLGVGWREILSWYPVELVKYLGISMARTIVQQGSWVTRGVQGPYYCWDPSEIPHHSMGLVSEGISSAMDPVIESPHTFIYPTSLVMG